MGDGVGEGFQLLVRFHQLGGPLSYSPFELLVEDTDLRLCLLALGDLVLGFLVEPSVVHGHSSPAGEVLSQLKIGLLVASSRLRCHQRDHPQSLSSRDQRHNNNRRESQPAHEPQVLSIPSGS